MLGDEGGAWIWSTHEPSGAASVYRLLGLISSFFSLQKFLHGPHQVERSKPLRGPLR
jgi:hypothetical protein